MVFAIQRMPAAQSTELVLPTVELPRGVDVKGSVVDEQGQPVAGAQVESRWEGARSIVASALARTDQDGRFVLLRGVDPLAELKLTAWDGFASLDGAMIVRAEAAQTKPIVLRIEPKNTAPLGGRVIDLAGNPVAGASIQLWRREHARDGRETVIDANPVWGPISEHSHGFARPLPRAAAPAAGRRILRPGRRAGQAHSLFEGG